MEEEKATPPGLYWIRWKGNGDYSRWLPAMFCGKHWDFMGNERPCYTNDFFEIGPPCNFEADKLVAELRAENERLAAIVSKLDHTADGVPITRGMTLYEVRHSYTSSGLIVEVCEWRSVIGLVKMDYDSTQIYLESSGWVAIGGLSSIYSTRSAAEAVTERFA